MKYDRKCIDSMRPCRTCYGTIRSLTMMIRPESLLAILTRKVQSHAQDRSRHLICPSRRTRTKLCALKDGRRKCSGTPLLTLLFLGGFLPAVAHAQLGSSGMTRAEFVRLVMEEQRIPAYGGSRCFTDVVHQSFAPHVCAAKQYGMVTGDPSGRFRPNDRILFIEAAAVVVRAEGTAVPYDPLWYRPYLDQIGEWNAYPASLYNIFDAITGSQALEMIEKARSRGQGAGTQRGIALQVTSSDDTPKPGDRVTFRIRLENTSTRDLRDIDMSALLDTDMDYVSSSDGGAESRGDVEWNNIRINARSSKTIHLIVEINHDARDGDTLRLRVHAEGKAASKSIEISDQDDEEEVRIDMNDTPDPVRAGETIMYRLTLENRENDLVRVTPMAFLDEDMSFISASDGGRRYGDTVVWDSLNLHEDEGRTLTLWVRVDDDAHNGDSVRLRVEANGNEESEMTEVENGRTSGNDVRVSITDSPRFCVARRSGHVPDHD